MKNTGRRTNLLRTITLIFVVIFSSHVLPLKNVQAYNANGYNYYDQLSSREKSVYNELAKITPSDREIDLREIFKDITGKDYNKLSDQISDYVSNAILAFIHDYPEIFWIKKWDINFEFTRPSNSETWHIKEVHLILDTIDIYEKDTQKLYNEVQGAINNFKVSGSTRYEKLKYIHDWLVSNVEYDESAVYAHEPYGALIDGKAVCEGYAEAFKLLCDKFSIPCILVTGRGYNGDSWGDHMWNYVQMEDGKWYAVDVTWDDPIGNRSNKIYYDYFLVGAKTTSNFNMEFSQSHKESGDFSGENKKIFVYPALSPEKFDPNAPVVSPTKPPVKTPSPGKTPAPSVTTKPSAAKTPSASIPGSSSVDGGSSTDSEPVPGTTENSPIPNDSSSGGSNITSTQAPLSIPEKTGNFSPDNTEHPISTKPDTFPNAFIIILIIIAVSAAVIIVIFILRNT